MKTRNTSLAPFGCDLDGNHRLSDEERTACQALLEAGKWALKEEYDANGNGIIDGTEIAALHHQISLNRQAKLVERFDTNGDGALGAEDRAIYRAQVEKGLKAVRGSLLTRSSESVAEHDTDSDGNLKNEAADLARERQSRRKERRLEVFNANGEGTIIKEEDAAKAEGRTGARRGRIPCETRENRPHRRRTVKHAVSGT